MAKKTALPQSALELIDFPSDFPLKVFGVQTKEFEVQVFELVKSHCPDGEEIIISSRESSNGKYTALTLTFTAYSKQQLEKIYHDLYHCEHVVMTL